DDGVADLAQGTRRELRTGHQPALEGRLGHGQGRRVRRAVLRCRWAAHVPALRPDGCGLAAVKTQANPESRETGGPWIESEIGTRLRLAECERDTPRVVPKSREEDVIFDLWEVVQQDIWHAWMLETDPANLQPKVRPLNRRVADFIRANTPTEMDVAYPIDRILDTGLEPFRGPEPLPPIRLDEIELVCRLALSPEPDR